MLIYCCVACPHQLVQGFPSMRTQLLLHPAANCTVSPLDLDFFSSCCKVRYDSHTVILRYFICYVVLQMKLAVTLEGSSRKQTTNKVVNTVQSKNSTSKCLSVLQSYQILRKGYCQEQSGIIVRRPKALGNLDFFTHIGRY